MGGLARLLRDGVRKEREGEIARRDTSRSCLAIGARGVRRSATGIAKRAWRLSWMISLHLSTSLFGLFGWVFLHLHSAGKSGSWSEVTRGCTSNALFKRSRTEPSGHTSRGVLCFFCRASSMTRNVARSVSSPRVERTVCTGNGQPSMSASALHQYLVASLINV